MNRLGDISALHRFTISRLKHLIVIDKLEMSKLKQFVCAWHDLKVPWEGNKATTEGFLKLFSQLVWRSAIIPVQRECYNFEVY